MNTETPQYARQLPIGGTHNFRDVGGYPTAHGGAIRWRTLFRSDGLQSLTEGGRQAVEDLGLVTAIDLRYELEVERRPSVLAGHPRIAYRNRPLGPPVGPFGEPAVTYEELNVYFLDRCQPFVTSILGELANARAYPALLSCHAGRDRTGLIVALLLSLAEVPREHVVADYSLTGRHVAELLAEYRALATPDGYDALTAATFLESFPATMEHALDHLEQHYGGAEGYVREIGLADDAIEAIRSALVEP